MQKVGKMLIVSTLVVLPIHLGFADDGEAADKSMKWQILVQSVQDILTGTNSGQTAVSIAPGAQLAIGDTPVSLFDVVGGTSKTHSLLEESGRTPVTLHLKMNDEENAAFLLIGTQPEPKRVPRYHTVVFMKDSTGMWLIQQHLTRFVEAL